MGHCELLASEIERFAEVITDAPRDAAVASCPGWSIGDLTGNLGTVHRWAEHLVRVRATKRMSTRAMGLGEPGSSPAWLRAGGQALVATLRSADPDEAMWAWGADQHVRFWSRRQLHETMVHRMDAELALGKAPAGSPAVAADAIDEFLVNLPDAATFSPGVRNLRGNGARLMFQATDEDRAWVVTLRPDGFELSQGPGACDAMLAGPAVALVLVLYRRLPVTSPGMATTGDASLVGFWLANSALE